MSSYYFELTVDKVMLFLFQNTFTNLQMGLDSFQRSIEFSELHTTVCEKISISSLYQKLVQVSQMLFLTTVVGVSHTSI
jgi:hypothetical protein